MVFPLTLNNICLIYRGRNLGSCIKKSIDLLNIRDLYYKSIDEFKKKHPDYLVITRPELIVEVPPANGYLGQILTHRYFLANGVFIFDLQQDFFIKPDDYGFDYFFAFMLIYTDELEVEQFLNLQLQQSFDNDFSEMSRLLKIVLLKYTEKNKDKNEIYIPESVTTLAKEWMDNKGTEMASHAINSNIEWKGSQTDLVALIYSLYHSDMLTNTENQRTKLLQDIAAYFGVEMNNPSSLVNRLKNAKGQRAIETLINKINNGYGKINED